MNIRQLISVERSDESIFIFARPFILSFLPWLLLGLGLVIIGIVFILFVAFIFPDLLMTNFQFDIFVVMVSAYFLLVIPFFTVGFIDYYYDLFIVTDRRLLDIDQHSLFSRNVSELALEQVEDVSASTNGILRTFFDFGDVTIQSAGAKEQFVFEGILHPREITEIVLDLADQAKLRIERGTDHIMPTGPVKAVIENRLYTSLDPLYKIGAMVPHEPEIHSGLPEEASASTPTPSSSSSPSPAPVVPPASPPADDLDIVIENPDNS